MRSRTPLLVVTILVSVLILSSCLLPLDEYWYRLAAEQRTLFYSYASAAVEDSPESVYVAVPRDEYSTGGRIVKWEISRNVVDVSDYSGTVVLDMIATRDGVLVLHDEFSSTILEHIRTGYSTERTYPASSSVISIDPWSSDGFSTERVLLSPESPSDPYRVLEESSDWSTTRSRTYTQSSVAAVFARDRGRVYHLKASDEQGSTPIWYHPVDAGTASLGDAVDLTWNENNGLAGPLLLSPDENTLVAGNAVFDVSNGLDYLATLPGEPALRAFIETGELVNITVTNVLNSSVTPGELRVWSGDWATGSFVTVLDLDIEPAAIGPSSVGLLVVGRELSGNGGRRWVQIHRVPAEMIQSAAGAAK